MVTAKRSIRIPTDAYVNGYKEEVRHLCNRGV